MVSFFLPKNMAINNIFHFQGNQKTTIEGGKITITDGDNNIIIQNNDGVTIIDGVVYDKAGKALTEIKLHTINITVEGNAGSIINGSGAIKINGNAESVKTGSGNITVGDVSGDVKTGSGNVQAGNISGSVKTGNGNITYRK